MFKPVYRYDVTIPGPDGKPEVIAKHYALTTESADKLAKILNGKPDKIGVPLIVTVEQRPAYESFNKIQSQILSQNDRPLIETPPNAQEWDEETATVPYLVVQDGPDSSGPEARWSRFNAALVAQYWDGNNEEIALRKAMLEISTGRYNQNPTLNAAQMP